MFLFLCCSLVGLSVSLLLPSQAFAGGHFRYFARIVTFSCLATPPSFEEEPGSAFALIDPNFDQTGCGNITMLVAHVVRLAQSRGERLVVLGQFGQHVAR